ncbi:hypothetical protein HanPSC8_Chr06g0243121 [Helianthus annuus]|nr:hypothetical protein HanPSC8_Chr06g0243121 [Helianthus annuus]
MYHYCEVLFLFTSSLLCAYFSLILTMIKIDSPISNGSSLPGVDRTNHFFEWRFNSY